MPASKPLAIFLTALQGHTLSPEFEPLPEQVNPLHWLYEKMATGPVNLDSLVAALRLTLEQAKAKAAVSSMAEIQKELVFEQDFAHLEEARTCFVDLHVASAIKSTLEVAATRGHAHAVAWLLNAGVRPSPQSWTLKGAAKNGHVEVVRLVLPFCNPSDEECLALRRAVEFGHTDVVDLLLPLCDIREDISPSAPLLLAAQHNHPAIFDRLLPVSDAQGIFMELRKFQQWKSLDALVFHLPSNLQIKAVEALSEQPEVLPRTLARLATLELEQALTSSLSPSLARTPRPSRL